MALQCVPLESASCLGAWPPLDSLAAPWKAQLAPSEARPTLLDSLGESCAKLQQHKKYLLCLVKSQVSIVGCRPGPSPTKSTSHNYRFAYAKTHFFQQKSLFLESAVNQESQSMNFVESCQPALSRPGRVTGRNRQLFLCTLCGKMALQFLRSRSARCPGVPASSVK